MYKSLQHLQLNWMLIVYLLNMIKPFPINQPKVSSSAVYRIPGTSVLTFYGFFSFWSAPLLFPKPLQVLQDRFIFENTHKLLSSFHSVPLLFFLCPSSPFLMFLDSQRSHISTFTMKLMDKFHSPKIKRTPSKKGKQSAPEPAIKSTEKPVNKVLNPTQILHGLYKH